MTDFVIAAPPVRPRTTLDRLGVVASTACLVHCAALPFVAVLVPALGATWVFGEVVGSTLAGVSVLVALVAAVAGLFRHRRWTPAAVALVAAACLVLAELRFEGESWVGPALAALGGVGLVVAHLVNIRLLRRCPCCPPPGARR